MDSFHRCRKTKHLINQTRVPPTNTNLLAPQLQPHPPFSLPPSPFLTHTHTHTHTPSFSPSLSFSLTHTHTHTLTHSLTLSLTHTHTHTQFTFVYRKYQDKYYKKRNHHSVICNF